MKEVLAVHRKALALRRELAAEPGADVETRLAVARSVHPTGELLRTTGEPATALAAFQEERDLASTLLTEAADGRSAACSWRSDIMGSPTCWPARGS